MKPKTLKALKGSILKWEKIVKGTGTNEGPRNCPLCKLFWFSDCLGCPVKDKVKQSYCDGTPFRQYCRGRNIDSARAELDFLKSLLPKSRKVSKN